MENPLVWGHIGRHLMCQDQVRDLEGSLFQTPKTSDTGLIALCVCDFSLLPLLLLIISSGVLPSSLKTNLCLFQT